MTIRMNGMFRLITVRGWATTVVRLRAARLPSTRRASSIARSTTSTGSEQRRSDKTSMEAGFAFA